jgi:hypothetical protein
VLGPLDYVLWLTCVFVEAGAVVCLLYARSFKRYFPLVIYLCARLAVDVGRYLTLGTFGYASNNYFYFYYYSDFLLTICLYFVLMGLYSRVFSDMGVGKYLRGGALLLLGSTALISSQMVAASSDRLVTYFVIELSRNLYFVGVLLTYLLWGTMLKMRENRTRLLQLVLAMGVFFSAYAASYALGNLYPKFEFWRYVSHLLAMWLPLSWAYTFMKVPEDARMATSSVIVPSR